MITTVYLLRHAQYAGPEHILPFRLPGFHLSAEGRETAQHMAKYFMKRNIAAVYTSPLERCRETAEIIAAELHLPAITDDRLLEVRSSAQGKREGFPESMGGWQMYETDWYKREGGETPQEVFARMDNFVKEKASQYLGKEIIVVSHGDPIMFLVVGYLGKQLVSQNLASMPYIQMGQNIMLTCGDADLAKWANIHYHEPHDH